MNGPFRLSLMICLLSVGVHDSHTIQRNFREFVGTALRYDLQLGSFHAQTVDEHFVNGFGSLLAQVLVAFCRTGSAICTDHHSFC